MVGSKGDRNKLSARTELVQGRKDRRTQPGYRVGGGVNHLHGWFGKQLRNEQRGAQALDFTGGNT